MKQRKDYPLRDYYRKISGHYDLVNRIFTFGRDTHWRRKAAEACLQGHPGKILDICTGTGDFILEVADRVTEKTRLYGYDFSEEMLSLAREKAVLHKHPVEFIKGDVGNMPFESDFFDALGITFGIRNLVYENSNAETHLKEMNRVLKPTGSLVILESSKPANRIWRLFNAFYLRIILPCLGGVISGDVKAYRYLAVSSQHYYTAEEMAGILSRAGFRVTQKRSLFLGSVMLLVAEKVHG